VSSEGNEDRGGLLEGTLLEAPGTDPSIPAAASWANISEFKGEEKTFIQLEA
jgi:hypothetical protein